MSDILYEEALEELKDELAKASETMEGLVLRLQDKSQYRESSDVLFRMFHNIRDLSQYSRALNIYKTAKIVEEILAIVKHKNPPFPDELLDWLLLIKDFITDWSNEFELGNYNIEPIDSFTLNMVQSSLSSIPKDKDILKKLNISFMHNNETAISRFNEAMDELVNSINIFTSIKKLDESLKHDRPDILVIPMQMGRSNIFQLIERFSKRLPDIPIVLIRNKDLTLKELKKFSDLNAENFMDLDTDEETIKQQISWIAKSYYGLKGIKLLTSPLLKSVSSLAPLPSTIIKLQEFRKNPKSSMRELSAAVSNDMALSGRLLQFVNAPGVGLIRNITSIHQAISLLGKDKTIALATQASLNSLIDIDVSAYGMSSDEFYEIGQKRMSLIIAWYSKVSISDTAMLATAALLGNIGQVVLSAEIKRKKIENEFLDLANSTNTMFAEIEKLYTTVEDTTADILTHWGLESLMVNAIRYSLDLSNADNENKRFAIALFVTFKTIPVKATEIDINVVDEMADFLKEMNLNPKLYLNAVKKVL